MSLNSGEPQLLDKLAYLKMLAKDAAPTTFEKVAEQVLSHAASVWESVGLKPRKLRMSDIVGCYTHGDRKLFHIKAYPRKRPETVLVIATDSAVSETGGHILIDLATEYSTPRLDCPSCEYDGNPRSEEMESLLSAIEPDDDDPFAVLEVGDGTYIQTLCGDDGYILEHQLVNTSSHYKTIDVVSFEQVVDAFRSYGFGGLEWLEALQWQRQQLE